jgi:multiple sugar transport system substrate-binding protein
MKRIVSLFFALVVFSSFALTAAPVTIEMIQWWEPELPAGTFRAIMDDFEAQNPGIKVNLVSGPYASIHDQIVTGAATGTLADVVGLDGAWVNEFAKAGTIAQLDPIMASANYDPSQLAAIIKLADKSYMIPAVSFIYPVFYNMDMLKAAGINKVPETRTEFLAAARKLTKPAKNQYGWVLPLSLEVPHGVQNDVMAWVWASGKKMLKDGEPNFTELEIINVLKYIQTMYKEGLLSPGTLAKQDQDKIEEFVNGRVGMMINSLALLNTVHQRNPSMNVGLSALPSADGYKGSKGLAYACWGIGVNANSKHTAEAWKLVSYLLSPAVSTHLANIAHGLPGNKNAAQPEYVTSDPIFAKGFQIFKSGSLINEFTGLPTAEDLMRTADTEIQLMLEGKQTAEKTAANVQASWSKVF